MGTWRGGGGGGREWGDTSMAQHVYLLRRTPVLSSGFGESNRGFMFLFVFGTSYVALFNALVISDIRILVLHVYCCLLQLLHFY